MNQNVSVTHEDMKNNHRCLLHNVTNDYSACTILLRAITAAILLAESYHTFYRRVLKYNRNDPEYSITPVTFLWKQRRTIKDNQERNNLYTDIFGWHPNPSCRKRKDIRDTSVQWMHLMHTIASTLMQTCITFPSCLVPSVSKNYMTFNPYVSPVTNRLEPYLTSLHIGHFWSQMTKVSEYAEIIKRLNQSAHQNSVAHNMMFVDTQ